MSPHYLNELSKQGELVGGRNELIELIPHPHQGFGEVVGNQALVDYKDADLFVETASPIVESELGCFVVDENGNSCDGVSEPVGVLWAENVDLQHHESASIYLFFKLPIQATYDSLFLPFKLLKLRLEF